MEEKRCETCKHFRLHYIKYGNRQYHPLHYGHCTKPRLKKRFAQDKGCDYWALVTLSHKKL